MNASKRSRRDRLWQRTNLLVLGYSAVFIVLIQYVLTAPVSAALKWGVIAAAVVSGQALWLRQYRVLDELGKQRFLKGFMVGCMVLGNGVVVVLLYGVIRYQSQIVASPLRNDPLADLFWLLYALLVLFALTMTLTTAYLRWRDSRP